MTLRFGTDGIRGVANRELTPELVTALGRAAVRVLGSDRPLVVGRDTRRSGPMLESALVAGICAEGGSAELLGVLPTPGLAGACVAGGTPGAMISASHNPYPDNGIKFFGGDGFKLTDDEEHRVEQLLAEPFDAPTGYGVGVSQELLDGGEAYVEHIASVVDRDLSGLRVAVDCANGAASPVAGRLFDRLGV